MCATPAARRAVLKQSWEISKPFSLEPGIGKKDASTQERRQKNVNNTKMRNIVAGKYILLIHSSEQDLRPGPNLPKKFHHKNQKMCIACRKQVAVVIQDFLAAVVRYRRLMSGGACSSKKSSTLLHSPSWRQKT